MSILLIDLIILLIAAVIIVPLFQSIRLGAVPGFLVAGVLVGPSGLGSINKVSEITYFAEIGVVLLLFVIGIELKPSRLWSMRRLVFGLGSLQVLVTGLILGLAAYFLLDAPAYAAFLIGPAMALSSTAFVLQLLNEQKILHTPYGQTSFSVLLLQDLAVVPLLALVPLLAATDLGPGENLGLALFQSVAILALVIAGGHYFLHPVLKRVALSNNPEVFTASAVLIVLGAAMVTEHIGMSMAMGAFLAGLLISDSVYRHQVIAEIQPFRGLLLGLFFMSMGMSLNIQQCLDNPLESFLLLIGLITFKIISLWPLTRLFGMNSREGAGVSLLLAQSGEFALVLFALAYQAQLLSEDLFQKLLTIVLLSMLMTPVLARFAYKIVIKTRPSGSQELEKPASVPIVIAGFGRVGHRVGDILASKDLPYIALDLNASLVELERHNGYPVFFGDVRQPEVLRAAGASHAELVIVTLNDRMAAEQVVAGLRQDNPDIVISARGHSASACQRLKKLGATAVVSENVEASLELARIALCEQDIPESEQEEALSNFRESYYSQIDAVLEADE